RAALCRDALLHLRPRGVARARSRARRVGCGGAGAAYPPRRPTPPSGRALAFGLAGSVAVGPGRLQLAATALALAVPAAIAVVAADLLEASGWLAASLFLFCALALAVPFVLRSAAARAR